MTHSILAQELSEGMMEFKDYYKIMGVARDATEAQIKQAYRKLARKYHPDVSKEKDAEARFKEVGEAYEVLKSPEKRAAPAAVARPPLRAEQRLEEVAIGRIAGLRAAELEAGAPIRRRPKITSICLRRNGRGCLWCCWRRSQR